jgi:MoxR-like ATPase
VSAWLQDRSYVTPEDVQAVFFESVAHRLCYQPVYEMRRHEIAAPLLAGILNGVAAP